MIIGLLMLAWVVYTVKTENWLGLFGFVVGTIITTVIML